MGKNIVITGGLGYVGTELCKIYSGESWNNNIIVIDNRFISERVRQLNEWGIQFIHGDILDYNFVSKHLGDANIVHHLAGITDVAKVSKESNKEKDDKLNLTAIQGTSNILSAMNYEAKIIFPSTHVIFEGEKNLEKDINEKKVPSPILAYSTSKLENEKQIKNSGKNFVILRLGSVYGYSNDCTRLDIMPNLFSKISSQNGTINLFSGGKQLKSLVPLIDVVRCFKLMSDSNKIKKETYNLVKDSVTVKEVAEICKKTNPKTSLKITDEEVPNPGYSLSNKKLLGTGFNFLYNLEDSIKEMISCWTFNEKIKNRELEYVRKGEKEFIDDRGKISNHELPEPINLIGLIDSVKGSMRANHFHPIQEQKILLVKGQLISVYKSLLEKNSHKITHLVNAGESVVTRPNVAHTMVFTKDSIFLNLVRGEREHGNYGVTHTLPYQLVSNEERKDLLKIYKFDCRSCGSFKLKRVVSLGYKPLANNLLNNKKQKDEMFPLEVNYCSECHNCQLSVTVDPQKMFSNYLYLSSTTKTMRDHFESAAKKYIKEFNLSPKKSYIIDIGSNDGVALKPFKNLKFKNLLGIEPAKNLAKLANKQKIKTFNGFLIKKNLKKVKKNADLILASNVFAHSDKLKEMAECMFKLLKSNGTIVIEIQYLLNTLKDLTFDNIYHEHYNYWSLTSLKNFFDNFKSKIFRAERIDTHGGSLRVYIKKNSNVKIENSVKKLLNEENKFGIKKYDTYQKFAKKVYKIRENVRKNILKLKKDNHKLIAYGSPAKATTALNFFGISTELDSIIEDNKFKQGKFLPGMKIPIISKKNLKEKPSHLIVLAWNFFEEIKNNNHDLAEKFINIKDLEND